MPFAISLGSTRPLSRRPKREADGPDLNPAAQKRASPENPPQEGGTSRSQGADEYYDPFRHDRRMG